MLVVVEVVAVVVVTMKRAVFPAYVAVAPEAKWSINIQGSGGVKGVGAGPIVIFTTADPSPMHGSGGSKPVNARISVVLFMNKVPETPTLLVAQGLGGKKRNNVPFTWLVSISSSFGPSAWSTTKISDGVIGSGCCRVRSAATKTYMVVGGVA